MGSNGVKNFLKDKCAVNGALTVYLRLKAIWAAARKGEKMKKKNLTLLTGALFAAEQKMAEEQGENVVDILSLFKSYTENSSDPEKVKLWELFLAGKPLSGKNGLRRQLAAIDLSYFGRAYLPHYFCRPSPAFHGELDDLWQRNVVKGFNPLVEPKKINQQKGSRTVTAAPRGHAKSTNLTFKDALHAVLFEYKHYVIILSDSGTQACGFLSAITEELEENSAIIEDFGEQKGKKVWREEVIITASGVKVEALGAGMKIRGRKHKNWRPDLLILDDVENDENVRTIEQRKKLYSWFTKAVSKCGDSYTDIVYIGTLLHYDSLLAKVLKNPGYKSRTYKAVLSFSLSPLWDEWEALYTDLDDPGHEETALAFFESNKAEMLADTEVLWEEKNSYYDLMKSKIEDGVAAFNSELQNEPIDPENCIFLEDWFDFYEYVGMSWSPKEYLFYGAVDPSLGKSKKSDYSAIITLAKHVKTGYKYVVEADIARRHPDQIISSIMEKIIWIQKAFDQRYTAFGAETVQFQYFLKEKIAEESARRGLYLPIVEINSNSNKELRITALQPEVRNKYIKFRRQDKLLLEQLKEFPMGSHDDGPDALEMANTLASARKRKVRVKTFKGGI